MQNLHFMFGFIPNIFYVLVWSVVFYYTTASPVSTSLSTASISVGCSCSTGPDTAPPGLGDYFDHGCSHEVTGAMRV